MSHSMSTSSLNVGKGYLNHCEGLRFQRVISLILKGGSFLRLLSAIVGSGEIIVSRLSHWFSRLNITTMDAIICSVSSSQNGEEIFGQAACSECKAATFALQKARSEKG